MPVELDVVPHAKETLIIVGSAIRKPLPVVRAWLEGIATQELPPNTVLRYAFVLDTADEMVRQYVASFVQQRGGIVGASEQPDQQDYADTGQTHHWSPSAMKRVGELKNVILNYAREQRADYVWLLDADLICDRTTLASLLSHRERVVCAVYWTRWFKAPEVTRQVIHAAPQVWLNHPYQLDGRGYEEWEFRKKLLNRQVTQVWGQGACTLIRADVLQSRVDFSLLTDLPTDGMWQGEDRHFCVKCERLHIPMYADPWPDIFHVYHEDDKELLPQFAGALATPHPPTPKVGDWVNFNVEALEGLVNLPGGGHRHLEKIVRGRLGGMRLLPELEAALLTIQRGEQQTVACHIGIDYPIAAYRGQRRLFRLTLIDCKPWGYAPVVRDELFTVDGSGTALDQTTLTKQQIDGVREEATA